MRSPTVCEIGVSRKADRRHIEAGHYLDINDIKTGISLMKIYIAGKISGLVYEDALRSFIDAEAALQQLGHEPVNPMRENGLDGDGKEHPWSEYMKRAIPHLLRCDGIYLLSNWRDSRGAKLECQLVHDLEMKVLYERHHLCNGCGKGILDAERRSAAPDIVCQDCFTLAARNGIESAAELRESFERHKEQREPAQA
jgi:hypothetical protein